MHNQVTSVSSLNDSISSLPHIKNRTSIFPVVHSEAQGHEGLLFSHAPQCIKSITAASEDTQHPATYIFKTGAGELALVMVQCLPYRKRTSVLS